MSVTPFSSGTKVYIRNNSLKKGVIIGEPIVSGARRQYRVFFGSEEERIVSEADLLAIPELAEDQTGQIQFGDLSDLLRHLLLAKLRGEQGDSIYSLYASRTKFEVYQFKPALKFLRNPEQRLLIADEVGLGKT